MNELVDGPVTVHVGDVLSVLRQLPSASVHCVVTSPPYWGLRDYGTAEWEGGEVGCDHRPFAPAAPDDPGVRRSTLDGGKAITAVQATGRAYRDLCGKCGAHRVDSQLGLEPTPELYVEHLVEVFREVRRVLRSDGTCRLNLGDSYAGNRGNTAKEPSFDNKAAQSDATLAIAHPKIVGGLKPKDLVGIPWRVAFALQADGWWLRSDIVWSKPNPMPESITDRPTKAHEYLFLLTRAERYFYDADAVREAHARDWSNGKSGGTMGPGGSKKIAVIQGDPNYRNGHSQWERTEYPEPNPNGRNLRSVWTIATQPFAEAHFATFPEDLVIPCIKAGTSEHGVCPQCGSPWERVTNTQWVAHPNGGHMGYKSRGDPAGMKDMSVYPRQNKAVTTTGWRPTCAHNRQPVPATVLDPFAGSGTTLAVARRLGRRAVGIELQADYLPLIRKRIAAGALPLLELLQVEEATP